MQYLQVCCPAGTASVDLRVFSCSASWRRRACRKPFRRLLPRVTTGSGHARARDGLEGAKGGDRERMPADRERPGRLAERLYALERRRQSPRAGDTWKWGIPLRALPAEAAGPAADAVSVVGLHPRLAQPAGWAQALACVQAHPLKPMTGSPGGEVLGGASLSGDAPVVGVTAGGEPATGAAVVLGQEGLRERDYGGVGVGAGAGVEAG